MKSIRNIAFSVLLTLGAFTAVTYTSCNKDECKDVVCNNGGTCNETDGSCTCATGYEGTNCDTKFSTKYVGTWTVTESCSNIPSNAYQVIVSEVSANQLLIKNLGNYDCSAGDITWTANLTASGSFTIAEKKCETQMNATGTYSNGQISITYTAIYDGDTDNCTATLKK